MYCACGALCNRRDANICTSGQHARTDFWRCMKRSRFRTKLAAYARKGNEQPLRIKRGNTEQMLRAALHGIFCSKFHLFFRSEEHTAELQSLMRSSDDVFCLKK